VRIALASLIVMLGCNGSATAETPADVVTVIRGADASANPSEGVIVMRPAPGSFLRETSRLADKAAAREERAAAERARYADLLAAQALESLANAAYAAQSRSDDDWYHSHVWVMNSRPMPRTGNRTLAPVARASAGTAPP
jgi:hypothetical protein